jgi:hypothetical protein
LKRVWCNDSKLHLLPLLVASSALVSALGHLFSGENKMWNVWTSAFIFALAIICALIGQSVSSGVWPLRLLMLLLLLDSVLRLHILVQLFPAAFGWQQSEACDRESVVSVWCTLDAESTSAINGYTLHVTCLMLQLISVCYAARLLLRKRCTIIDCYSHETDDATKIELNNESSCLDICEVKVDSEEIKV